MLLILDVLKITGHTV